MGAVLPGLNDEESNYSETEDKDGRWGRVSHQSGIKLEVSYGSSSYSSPNCLSSRVEWILLRIDATHASGTLMRSVQFASSSPIDPIPYWHFPCQTEERKRTTFPFQFKVTLLPLRRRCVIDSPHSLPAVPAAIRQMWDSFRSVQLCQSASVAWKGSKKVRPRG